MLLGNKRGKHECNALHKKMINGINYYCDKLYCITLHYILSQSISVHTTLLTPRPFAVLHVIAWRLAIGPLEQALKVGNVGIAQIFGYFSDGQ